MSSVHAWTGKTIIIPTTTDWDVAREGGTETFLRNLARVAKVRSIPLLLLSTGHGTIDDGSVHVRPVVETASTELQFVRRLRRQLRSGEIPLPAEAAVLANAEHYVWPFERKEIPIVLLAHGAIPPTLRETRGRFKTFMFERFLEEKALARCTAIVGVSEDTSAYYRSKFPQFATKVTTVPMGIDLSALPLPRAQSAVDSWGLGFGRPRILYVGRLSQEKGLPLIADACRVVRRSRPDLRLLVVGDGPLAPWLRSEARRDPWIRLLGHRPHHETLDLMLASDALVIASSYEGLPTVLLEAVSLGVPVVSTDVGCARDLLASDCGVVVGARPEAIAEGIVRVLSLDRGNVLEASERLRSALSFERTADDLFRILWKALEVSSPRSL